MAQYQEITWPDGTLVRVNNGVLINSSDVPAIEYPNGQKDYYCHGKVGKRIMPNGEIRVMHCEYAELLPDSTRKTITEEGVEEYRLNGVLHRINGPARVWPNGDGEYYQNGRLHRADGPAIIRHGRQMWMVNGILHREDGPAIDHGDGGYEYYQNHVRHRVDGPAVVRANGIQEFWINGELIKQVIPE